MVILIQVNNMKFLIYLLIVALSCSHLNEQESLCGLEDSKLLWTAFINKEGEDVIIKGTEVLEFISNQSEVLKRINNRYPKIGTKIDSISQDVIYVSFENASHFTQSIGTTGALHFQSCLVFSLTEGKGPQSVDLNYIGGDHGEEPGLRNREYFIDQISVFNCK